MYPEGERVKEMAEECRGVWVVNDGGRRLP